MNFNSEKTLSDLAVINLSKVNTPSDVFLRPDYQDAECQYILRWYQRIKIQKQLHFMRLCKLYYACTAFGEECVYYRTNFDQLDRWQVVQWAACELTFGFYHSSLHNKQRTIERIRMELPHENRNGRCLDFSLERFEEALAKHNPNLDGNVHDWYNVLIHVPTKILLYEEIFG